VNKNEVGGLSGPPIKPFSIKAMKAMRQQLPSSIPVIGCGGIASGRDALEYAKAGASMVQVYTSFGYDGVGACRRIKDELADELKKEGVSWGQVAKRAVDELSWKAPPPAPKQPEVPPENTVQQLISEAEELKSMLEKLEVEEKDTA
jgi:dihydroorotate dehydrogenase